MTLTPVKKKRCVESRLFQPKSDLLAGLFNFTHRSPINEDNLHVWPSEALFPDPPLMSLRSPEQSCVQICRMTEQNPSTAGPSPELQTLCWWLPDFCLSRSGHKRGDLQPRAEIRTLSHLPVSSLLSDCFWGSGGVTNNALLLGFCSQWPFLCSGFFFFFFTKSQRIHANRAVWMQSTNQCTLIAF